MPPATLTRQLLLASAIVITLLLAFGVAIVALTWDTSSFSLTTAGSLGDSFGIVNSLFSGLAFAGVIVTILLQRQELTESREIFRIQRFEGSFYRLLELYRKNLEDIRIVDAENATTHHGIDALSVLGKRLNATMQQYIPLLDIEEGRVLHETQLFIDVQKILVRQARYLGTLRSLLELVERDLPSDEERSPYRDILASQITSIEARYLFYCCLVGGRDDALRTLIHRAGLLDARVSNANLGSAQRALYERVHGIALQHQPTRLVMPYDKAEFYRQRKSARRAQKAAGAARPETE
jgi:hypothetical protein